MALTEENGIGATMLVGPASVGNMGGYPYPVYMNGGQNGGGNNGMGDNNGWWIVLLIILLAAGNGFGNNNGGGNGGFFGGMPYVVNNEGSSVQRGFDQAAIMSGITGIQSGVQNLSTQLCNCCADMSQTVTSGFANAETAANARQIANMQQAFAAQTAMAQGFNQLGTQFADCCCENRLANCQTQNIIQNEGNATRFADANNTRDIIQSQSDGTRAILDKLCQLELDGKQDRINDLERQLTLANLQASQTAQNAFIAQGFANEVDALYNRLSTCPVGTVPVAGSTPLFSCNPSFNGNNGCGCGCGNNF